MDSDYSVCPYDSTHLIVNFRMPGHILKCRKNYRGPVLEPCIYNACHLVPIGSMEEHLESCREHHLYRRSDYEKTFRKEMN